MKFLLLVFLMVSVSVHSYEAFMVGREIVDEMTVTPRGEDSYEKVKTINPNPQTVMVRENNYSASSMAHGTGTESENSLTSLVA